MLKLMDGLVPVQSAELEDVEGTAPSEKEAELDEEGCEDGQDRPSTVPRRLSAHHLHRLYVFSLVWSMGAFLDIGDRKKFSSFLHEKLASVLDLPASNELPDATVFDFMVSQQGKDSVSEKFMLQCHVLKYVLSVHISERDDQ
jgi:dynein heavy chain